MDTAVAILLLVAIFQHDLSAANYYVSPTGDDAKDGTAEATAWKTVAKVNAAKLAHPVTKSSSPAAENAARNRWSSAPAARRDKPVIYATYGKGAKPKFWGSEQLVNADFLPVDGTTYKYVFKHDVDRRMGVAVDHEPAPLGDEVPDRRAADHRGRQANAARLSASGQR